MNRQHRMRPEPAASSNNDSNAADSSGIKKAKHISRSGLAKRPRSDNESRRRLRAPSGSSDEDLDPELREGIHNIMKLRDEYDKLEGALRKLGVDPDTIVGPNHDTVTSEDEASDCYYSYEPPQVQHYHTSLHFRNNANNSVLNTDDNASSDDLDPHLCTPFNVVAVPASGAAAATSTASEAEESLVPATVGRLRHLDILEEVDESVLSSDTGEDPPSAIKNPSYPWIQMALPGGGIVSVPLESANSSAAGSVKGRGGSVADDLPSPASGRLQAMTSPTALQADLLTVAAGEPVTHFNLDQLLEIVQSFQLDTTMASHDEASLRSARGDLSLCSDLAGSKNIPSSGCDSGKHCDTRKLPRTSYRSSSSVIGCEASYLGYGLEDNVILEEPQEQQLEQQSQQGQKAAASSASGGRLEAHSCPSSPTETDCSSGFSTLRRRSVTLTEKIRTNKDGSKTQVVRQYGCNTSSANEPEQSVTYEKNSYVYINSAADNAPDAQDDLLPLEDATAAVTSSSIRNEPCFRTSASSTGSASMPNPRARMQPPPSNNNTTYRSHIVRLNSLEPNTVMFSTKDYPILSDVTVPEIIDELEKQFDDKLCELQGVRLVGSNVYICLSRKDSLNYLSTYGFYVRGVPVKVVDITHDSVVICLTGVPHYITDSTVTMLVSTFGIAIGEVERRFYKGVDTGERYVRLKPRAHTQVPDFVTVGGCKILIRVLSNEEVCPPYTLQSQEKERRPEPASMHHHMHHGEAYNSQTTASFANSSIVMSSAPPMVSSSSASPAAAISSTTTGLNFRAKPGHCNGSLNSPTGCSSSVTLPQLTTMQSPVARATDLLLSGIAENSEGSMGSSPKIAKSFRSRITLRSPPKASTEADHGVDEVDDRTYVAGDPINDIPSLSPPPYKGPGSTGGSSTTSNSGRGITTTAGTGMSNLLSRIRGERSEHDDYKANTLSRKFNRHMSKTDSSNSIGSNNNKNEKGCNGKQQQQQQQQQQQTRSSVVFEEPSSCLKTTTTTSHSSSQSTMPPPPSASKVATATNRTVNGILRKGSVPGDDIVSPPPAGSGPPASFNDKDKSEAGLSEKELKRKNKAAKSKKKSKLESVTESGLEDGDSATTGGKERSSRSRSSSSKASSSKADKAAKDLALTRDLPWCGCWGNGCL